MPRSRAKSSKSIGDLEAAPGTINEDPAGAGWFLKLKIADTSELDELMSEED